tara:strand:- start:2077 stop:3366 length:1290 start_codon:yes stop_codon:yes gene_type:complete
MNKSLLISLCKEWGYFYKGGIHDRKDLFRDKNVLDVGMGQGPHSIFYIENGAKSYTGVDPDMSLDGNGTVRNHTHNDLRAKFPFSPNDMMQLYSNIKLYNCLLEELQDDHLEQYDLIIMTMVTEHLQNNPEVIKQCYRYLKKGGIIWSSHANYYFWDGHHELPRYSQINSNENNGTFTYWKHLYPDSPVYYQTNLNRIKLKDLQIIFEKYFEVDYDLDLCNDLIPIIPENIKNDFPELSIEDLIAHHPIFIGKKRENILDIDVNNIEYYHPVSNIEKKITNLFIESDLKHTNYSNNKWDIIYQKRLFKNLKYQNNELVCETIEENEINSSEFKSCGIHIRLYDINLTDNNNYKLKFEIKSLHSNTNNKKVKIYTGIKWEVVNIPLNQEYQIIEFIQPFKFSGKSKFRIGIEDLSFNDSFSIKNISFTKC